MTLPWSGAGSGYPVPVGPVIVQSGSGLTVRITSSVLVQPEVSTTVRRNVAVPDPVTFTVAGRLVQPLPQEVPDVMFAVAVPSGTTFQVMDWMGLRPGCAVPVI